MTLAHSGSETTHKMVVSLQKARKFLCYKDTIGIQQEDTSLPLSVTHLNYIEEPDFSLPRVGSWKVNVH